MADAPGDRLPAGMVTFQECAVPCDQEQSMESSMEVNVLSNSKSTLEVGQCSSITQDPGPSNGSGQDSLNGPNTFKGAMSTSFKTTSVTKQRVSPGKQSSSQRNLLLRFGKSCKKKYLRQIRNKNILEYCHRQIRNKNILEAYFQEHYKAYLHNRLKPERLQFFPNSVYAISLSLKVCDPDVYEFVRTNLKLPSSTKLAASCRSVPMSSGISDVLSMSMMGLLPGMSEIDKICVLSFKRMPLKRQLVYDECSDMILGYQDIAGCRSPLIADCCLVIMLSGLISKWKQPVAYHVGQSVHEWNLDNIIRDTVSSLQVFGFKIVAIVPDFTKQNLTDLQVAVDISSPFYRQSCLKFYNNDIGVFSNARDLLRELWINCLEFDVQFTDLGGKVKVAKFDILRQFLEQEKKKSFSSIYPYYISDVHLRPNSKEKLDWKLAAQLFSYAVAVDLALHSFNTDNVEGSNLADFMKIIATLFCTFSSRKRYSTHNFNATVSENSRHHYFWSNVKNSLSDWKFIARCPGDKEPQSECFLLWWHNVAAVQLLWAKLKELGVKMLETKNLTQDSLESFCLSVGRQGGRAVLPSSKQLLDAFKILMMDCVATNLMKYIQEPEEVLPVLINLFNLSEDKRSC